MSFLKRLLSGQRQAPHNSPAEAPPPPFGTTVWHPTHRHRKGGGYRLLGYGVNEADRSPVAIYDDAEGTVWVRSAAEFNDGRFTPVTLVDAADQDPPN